MKGIRALGDRIVDTVGGLSLPKLGREVELPVYLIHNSPDAEDYFFIFDFEDFVEQSRQGWFVRPKLRLWAGRSDFNRRAFARLFRESFAQEFELARVELARRPEAKRGWFGGLPGFFRDIAAPSIPGMLANLVLLVAVSAGGKVLGQILPASWTRQKTDAQKLEEGITETQGKVDAALSEIEISLHMELYRHAWRGQPPGRLTGVEYDAWPLPNYVRQHLEDGTSGSWW
ncbi:hypothetical protein So717_30450 [Roseobacter cerasinus]|uniref:Uncharacterized protein n=1 Tax=Roseobacter cerasinus TaxID=2602289 RepID=A0A640VUE7_9RHOB|nr:hypothetical protein [Roseobacter cerasinus]GFE51292.1 hypothetical protein So717_30450 [Roseobacter cerasinus]